MRLDAIFDPEDEVAFLYGWLLGKSTSPVDNVVFYFINKFTCFLYLAACLIVITVMYFMDPIECISDESVEDVIDNFCFYHSTYTISNISAISEISQGLIPHPGVANAIARPLGKNGGVLKYHHYYLWMGAFLVFQAILFSFPWVLWKRWECGSVSLALELNNGTDPDQDLEKDTKLMELAGFIISKRHHLYYYKLLFCEVLNILNGVGQLFLMNWFLGSDFLNMHVSDFIELLREHAPFQREEHIDLLFPKVTSCTFHTYGPSGNRVSIDALCVLPVNVINEKLFAFLYLWIVFLVIPLSVIAVMYRIISTVVLRRFILESNISSDAIIPLEEKLKMLKKHLGLGNWQVLLSMGWNVDAWELTRLIKGIAIKVDKQRAEKARNKRVCEP